jgi:glycosyltransferase involved in cell wall biosynthesis
MTTAAFRPAFVLEQALGHVTHAQNLKHQLAGRGDIEPRWLDVPFEPKGLMYQLPPASRNWSLRGSLYARRALLSNGWRHSDALFVHTLTVGLFATPLYERVPTVLSLDATPINFDSLAEHYGHRVQSGPVERLKLAIARRAISKARAYVTWCEWAKDSLVADYGAAAEKVTVLAPGTDLELFRRPAGARRPGPVRILFVGGDFVRKGGDLLVDVYRRRLQGKAELHLISGFEVPPQGGVFLHKGLVANSEPLLDLYRDADVFALPTRADCLAVVLGEAAAASLPIVTTNVGGHPEVVENGRSGFVVERNDVEALGDSLETLVDDAALREAMGARSRQIAEERLDAGRNAEAILELMRSVA